MRMLPALAAFLCLATPALAQDPVRIGLSLPLSGPYKLLGEQARAGAEAAAAALAGGRPVDLIIADDACTAEGGKAAAAQFGTAKVQAVAGFLCTAPLLSAAEALSGADVPLITIGVRSDAVTGKSASQARPVFRLSPTSAQELEAVSSLLLPLWRGKKFAIIDDGTLRARELAESLRLAAEAEGIKPVFVDTYKPGLEDQFAIIAKLKKTGATHLFVGGDREDVAIIAQNAAAKDQKLTVAGSEVLYAAPLGHAMPDGVLMVGVPAAKQRQQAQNAVLAAGAVKSVAEGYYLPAFAAVQLVAGVSTAPDKPMIQSIQNGEHQTVLGTIRFAPNGDLMDNSYSVLMSKAGTFEIYQQ